MVAAVEEELELEEEEHIPSVITCRFRQIRVELSNHSCSMSKRKLLMQNEYGWFKGIAQIDQRDATPRKATNRGCNEWAGSFQHYYPTAEQFDSM